MIFKLLALVIIFISLFGCETKESTPLEPKVQKKEPVPITKEMIQKELSYIDSDAYVEAYIVKIINEGSNGVLGFSGGAMDAGIAAKEDALNIARFTLSLYGRKSSDDTMGKKSELFYTSNCGGCHGNDGKGLGGAFPDLTKKTFFGIERRKNTLQATLNSLINP